MVPVNAALGELRREDFFVVEKGDLNGVREACGIYLLD